MRRQCHSSCVPESWIGACKFPWLHFRCRTEKKLNFECGWFKRNRLISFSVQRSASANLNLVFVAEDKKRSPAWFYRRRVFIVELLQPLEGYKWVFPSLSATVRARKETTSYALTITSDFSFFSFCEKIISVSVTTLPVLLHCASLVHSTKNPICSWRKS